MSMAEGIQPTNAARKKIDLASAKKAPSGNSDAPLHVSFGKARTVAAMVEMVRIATTTLEILSSQW